MIEERLPLIIEHLRTEVPNAKQREFFEARETHVCYGGARGGGKSWAVRRKLVLMDIRNPGLRCLLLRRTLQDLRENHILPLRSELEGYAVFKQEERAFVFPNGSRLQLGYCDSERDLMQYQGPQYDVIAFEEATQFPEEWITFITTSARTTREGWHVRFLYTCNPGGPGHGYIKRLFIDRQFKPHERPEDYRFIPARLTDNPVLMARDPDYIRRLRALPPIKQRAHIDGDWSVYEGQVFEELRDDPDHYADRRWTHIIEPFDIPDTWRIYRGYDHGYSKPFSCGWWAVDHDDRLYRILELYGCVPDQPDTGVRWEPDRIFEEIAAIERQHPYLKGKRIHGIADPAIWEASRGESIADIAARHRVYFDPADNSRLTGWAQVHNRLAFDEQGIPGMYIFSTCKEWIRTMPLLIYDKVKPEDVDTHMEDHIADETRYVCMAWPTAPPVSGTPSVRPRSPLDPEPKPENIPTFYI